MLAIDSAEPPIGDSEVIFIDRIMTKDMSAADQRANRVAVHRLPPPAVKHDGIARAPVPGLADWHLRAPVVRDMGRTVIGEIRRVQGPRLPASPLATN